MNVVCPECGSIFRVDPAKIPLAGVRARCSVCGGVIAIGERGRIDDDFAAPHPAAAQSAPRPAQSAAAPAPLPPRPAITMPTPPQPSRAQVDALLSGMSRKSMPNVEAQTSAPATSAPAKPHASGSVPAVSAAPPAAPPVSHAAPTAPSAPAAPAAPPRPGFPFSHAPAPAAPGGAPVPRPAPPRMPTPAIPTPRVETAPPAQVPNAAGAGAPRPPAAPRPLGAPAPSVGHAAPAAAPRATAPVQRPTAPGSRAPINPFLSNDPNVKAKRLARALVSDIVAYFPDKHREGLRNGTLRELFREEIKKSYEEYVDQMTREFAESTTHFQDALNDVLAGGKRIF